MESAYRSAGRPRKGWVLAMLAEDGCALRAARGSGPPRRTDRRSRGPLPDRPGRGAGIGKGEFKWPIKNARPSQSAITTRR
jgi:hypothetical protein